MGLRLKAQGTEGTQACPPPLVSRAGDLTWEPSRLPGLKWAGQMPSSPLLLLWSGVWEGPSHLPLLIPPGLPSYAPRTNAAGEVGRGALEGRGLAWDLRRLPVPEWVGQSLLSCSSQRVPPASLSWSPCLCPVPPRTHVAWRGVWRAGDWPGSSAAVDWAWAQVGRAVALCSSPTPPEGPSRLPLLIFLASLLCPQDPCGLEGALEAGEAAWELSRLPGLSGPGSRPLLLSCSSRRVPPTCLS